MLTLRLYLFICNTVILVEFQALKDQAELFKNAHIPIHGIGVQSHIHNAHLDITAIKVR